MKSERGLIRHGGGLEGLKSRISMACPLDSLICVKRIVGIICGDEVNHTCMT